MDTQERLSGSKHLFIFGKHYRNRIAQLNDFGKTLSSELPRVARDVTEFPSLRHEFVTRLTETSPDPNDLQMLVEHLATINTWSFVQKDMISRWLYRNHHAAWKNWRESSWLFPPWQFHKEVDLTTFRNQISAENQFSELPRSVFLPHEMAAELNPESSEKYARDIILAPDFARGDIFWSQLLRNSIQRNHQEIAAAILAHQFIATPLSTLDVESFHRLEWDRHGEVKISVLTRQSLPQPLPSNSSQRRFAALQLWQHRRYSEAFKTLVALKKNAGSEIDHKSIARELSMIAMTSQDRRLISQVKLGVSDVLCGSVRAWVERIVNPRKYCSVEDLWPEDLPAPIPSDPLFANVVAFLEDVHIEDSNLRKDWHKIEKRLCAVDPLWKRKMAYPFREYVNIYWRLLETGKDTANLSYHLRRLLLLPYDKRGVQLILTTLPVHPSGLLSGGECDASHAGMILFSVCCRVVEHLESQGFSFSRREQEAFLSGKLRLVCGALVDWIQAND